VNVYFAGPLFIMVALLDGSQADDGTAWEIAYFYAKKSPE
jgi:nucleoside 2-deoxyribosyltransferase